MTLREFTSEKERLIVKVNVIYHFYQVREGWTLIEVSMKGMLIKNKSIPYNEWNSATTLVTDIEAEAIYTNLLKEELD